MMVRSCETRPANGNNLLRLDKDNDEQQYGSNKRLMIYFLHDGELYYWKKGIKCKYCDKDHIESVAATKSREIYELKHD